MNNRLFSGRNISVALLALTAAVFSAPRAHAATFTVTSAADSGVNTLRAAIGNANRSADVDTINFALTGTTTITLTSPLPAISNPVLINGYSQPGSQENQLAFSGTDAVPLVELTGTGAAAAGSGLEISANNSVVRGLTVNGFTTGILLTGTGNTVGGCFIGTTVAGDSAVPNDTGIQVDANANAVGGTIAIGNTAFDSSAAENRNVISGNTTVGVLVTDGTGGTTIFGNLIGTDKAGTDSVGNRFGIDVADSSGVDIGSSNLGDGNVISGNTDVGLLASVASDITVQGNAIGVGSDGSTDVGNGGAGISFLQVDDSLIGGSSLEGNVIGHNDADGITLAESNRITVTNNFIGTDDSGTTACRNAGAGVSLNSAVQCAIGTKIGGTQGNLIAGNQNDGIFIDGTSVAPSQSNTIEANFFSFVDTGGAVTGNGANGIRISDESNDTRIGSAGNGRNYISGNGAHGVLLDGTSVRSVLVNNFIGIDSGGTAAEPNGSDGVRIISNTNFLGDDTPGGRNVISGNPGTGVSITGQGNALLGNLIGTNAAGTAAVGNGDGVVIDGTNAISNIIGNAGNTRNVISGSNASFTGYGISISSGANQNSVFGCLIGTNAAGTALIPNQRGIVIDASPNNTVGAASTLASNVIGGGEYGVLIGNAAATGNKVVGNRIGTNLAGTASLANGYGVGIFSGASGNLIGGDNTATPNSFNVISGNDNVNILINGSNDNDVWGNRIGTREDGQTALGNFTTSAGIQIEGASTGNDIGGGSAGTRNIISGTANHGVILQNAGTSSNRVLGNYIGVGTDGTTAVPNSGTGVLISDGASNNIVGTVAAGNGNTIANNGIDGVTVFGLTGPGTEARGNSIRGNSIFSNTGLGINLHPAAESGSTATANDSGDGDTGPNSLQNSPTLSASVAGNTVTVTVTLSAVANTQYIIDLYRSAAKDPIAGEGQTYVSSSAADSTNSSGLLIKTFTAPSTGGAFFSATAVATTTATSTQAGDNSEFSPAVQAVVTPSSLVVTTTANSGAGSLRQAITNANSGSGTRTITFNIPAGQSSGGVWTIAPATALPALTGSNVVIDGTSQTTFGGNTNAAGPEVVLRGANGGFAGLTIQGSSNVIRGLVINNFRGAIPASGILIEGAANNNRIQGNYIGTTANGASSAANRVGIFIRGTARNTAIGGQNTGEGNTIAFNQLNGILNSSTNRGNSFLQNRIFSNGALGIDLSTSTTAGDGVTANDAGSPPDADAGPNALQNFPDLTVSYAGSTATIRGSLVSTPSTDFRVEYFSSAAADATGYGEGQNFLGFQNVTTDSNGRFPSLSFSASVPSGHFITATATRRTSPLDSSEFSRAIIAAPATPTTLSLSVAPTTISESGGPSAATATVRRTGATTSPLTVLIASGDTSEARVPASGQVVIPAGQTSVTYPVAAVDDNIVDGSQTLQLSARATGISAVTTNLTVADNDVAPTALTLTVVPTSISESGGANAATATVRRTGPTTSPLTVLIASGDTSEARVPASGQVIIPAGQSSATYPVAAVDDTVLDGPQTVVLAARATGISAVTDSLTVTDNDVPGVVVTVPSPIETTEAGGARNFAIRLAVQPLSSVTIPIESSDTTEGTVSPASVVFSPTNWNQDQVITVTGVNDALVDGDQDYDILIKPATGDARFNGFDAADVPATNIDDDGAPPVTGPLVWGYNEYGQLGDNSKTERLRPIRVAGFGRSQILAAGGGHSLAADSSGATASGYNAAGQLGNNSTTDRTTPGTVNGLTNVRAISAGWYHTLVLRNDGSVWAFGYNASGALGDGTNSDRRTPVRVTGLTEVIAVSAGTYHSVALKSDGTVWTWGNNFYGQLGDGGTTDKNVPVRAQLPAASAIAAGGAHTVAVAGGQVYTWGWNSDGQLGNGSRTTRLLPGAVAGISGASRVSAGYIHTLALVGSTVRAWGDNAFGQLGDNSTTDRLTPITAQITLVTSIVAGGAHSVALRSDRTLWAWGNNAYGGLGDGSRDKHLQPQPVPGVSNVTTFSAGYAHTMAAGDFNPPTPPAGLAEAATALSTISASATADTVSLIWTTALSASSAGNASNYVVAVNGHPVTISARYSAGSNTTVLTIDGGLNKGDTVSVRWSNLATDAGTPVTPGSTQTTAL